MGRELRGLTYRLGKDENIVVEGMEGKRRHLMYIEREVERNGRGELLTRNTKSSVIKTKTLYRKTVCQIIG